MKIAHKLLLLLLVVLLVARIYLPYWVKDYVNKVLDDVPGYTGSVEDVDISLYRGAYVIKKLKMLKTDEEVPVPFLDIDRIDLSVQWKSLLKGRLVGEVELYRSRVNFVAAVRDSAGATQSGVEADWTKPLKELMPLKINRFVISDGQVVFFDFSSQPKVDVSLDSLQLEALNLGNVIKKEEKLPSIITATARSLGDGRLTAVCRANLLKRIPDMDLDLKFENVWLPALNDFTKAYAWLDFEKGTFDLYTEMAIYDGRVEGYVKPLLTDLKVVDLFKEKDKPLQLAWEVAAGSILKLLENPPRDQFATKVPMKGNLKEPDMKVLPAIGNIFKNAFVKAFTKDTDHTIRFEDAISEKR